MNQNICILYSYLCHEAAPIFTGIMHLILFNCMIHNIIIVYNYKLIYGKKANTWIKQYILYQHHLQKKTHFWKKQTKTKISGESEKKMLTLSHHTPIMVHYIIFTLTFNQKADAFIKVTHSSITTTCIETWCNLKYLYSWDYQRMRVQQKKD